MPSKIRPIIMCGGAGTRLWPTSRNSLPKQFAMLLGERSTFQDTVLRLRHKLFERPIILTNHTHRVLAEKQLAEINASADIVLEPERRDSGPAILAGCMVAASQDSASQHADTPVLVVASDHVVTDPAAFRNAVANGLPAARARRLVTFGITARHACTEYGWIEPGVVLEGEARRVERFAEKPDGHRAAEYLLKGWLWNSGNFLFGAQTLIEEYRSFEPATVKAVEAALANGRDEDGAFALALADFVKAEKRSIDFAVMERTERAAVIATSCGWSDVGNWDALWALSDHDGSGNARRGNVELFDAHNCLVSTDGPMTSVLGVEDLIIVASRDAVLVADRSRAAEVKQIVELLRSKGCSQAETHSSVHYAWGSYQIVDSGEGFQVKRLIVSPQGHLSLQKHRFRSEHWVVVRGTATVTIDETIGRFGRSEHIFIPLGAIHQLENRGIEPLELISVQNGSYLGEDDVIRVDAVQHWV
ncbi:mannose-1-phosphate guanylyltransferase/mannose-6-phosphate isomerase [Bosea sp. OK403]|uniref:mannose-1-phosphate guanylyltransferase/mannose-6-phosphate isomerase n=1 Tax=Bosea sp. OK403 TaxID=1855286 RepID=UPI0008DF523A|nr:mannose-1-phosphate guanylyltransferase/mannose-6-phosphate isomerase [Bosea sp. OK403]SFI03954.1 mannose-1-phosphate guanylyltransferase/mannose-6-phosphate isomerase [Bosea sp. OK403]